jgi:hypothetical protein
VANEGATAIDTLATVMPTLVVQVQYAGPDATLSGTIATAILAGAPESGRVNTDQGLINGMSGMVRYKTSLEPSAWSSAGAIVGQIVKVLYYGMSDWTVADRFRVQGRKEVLGAVRLNLVAEYE